MDKRKQWESVVAILSGLLLCYWIRHAKGWLIAATLIGFLTLLIPALAQALHWGWTRLTLLLGGISGKVLLTVAYVFILLPMSFIARRWGTMTFRRKPGGGNGSVGGTYFKEPRHTYTKEDLMNPW